MLFSYVQRSLGFVFWGTVGLSLLAQSSPLPGWELIFPSRPGLIINDWATNGADEVVVGRNGLIMLRPDGEDWRILDSGFTEHFQVVAWVGDRFIALGPTGETGAYSVDGETWTADTYLPAPGQPVQFMGYNGSEIVVFRGQDIFYSSDGGMNWSSVAAGGPLASSAVWDGNFWFTAFNYATRHSADASMWTMGQDFNFMGYFFNGRDVAWDGTSFIVAGRASDGVDADIWSGYPGMGYSRIFSRPAPPIHRVRHLDFRWVIIGEDRLMVEGDQGWWDLVEEVDLHDVAFSGTQYVGVGKDGLIRTGATLDTLTTQTPFTSEDLLGVHWNGGFYTAVGENGAIGTSLDGMAWSAVPSGTTEHLRFIDYTDAQWFAAGDNGTVITKAQGQPWQSISGGWSDDFTAMEAEQGRLFLARPGGQMLFTEDGGNLWQARALSNNGEIIGINWTVFGYTAMIQHADGRLQYYTSADNGIGLLRDFSPQFPYMEAAFIDDARILMVPDLDQVKVYTGEAYGQWTQYWDFDTSLINEKAKAFTDGTLATLGYDEEQLLRQNGYWSMKPGTGEILRPYHLKVDGNRMVAVYENGILRTSTDGQTWADELRSDHQPTHYSYLNGRFFGSGPSDTLWVSDDGVHWTSQTLPYEAVAAPVAYGGGTYYLPAGQNGLLTSPDGENWTIVAYLHLRGGGITSVVCSDQQVVAASDDGLRFRKYFGPGTNWAITPVRLPHLRAKLHYTDGLFFNEGKHGFAVSTDGYNWQTVNAAFDSQDDPERGFTGVVYDGSQWVTTGDVIMVSGDGLTWTFDGDRYDSLEPKLVPPPKASPAEQGLEANQEGVAANPVRLLINDAVYTGSAFLAVGHQGAIYHISDAGVWTTIPSPVNQDLNDLVFALGQWIAVGNGGTIITSPDAANWTVRHSGIIEDLETVTGNASFALTAGLDGSVLRSSDAVTWAETPTGLTSDIHHSAYNGSLWLIGSETESAFSSDLIAWSPGSTGFRSLATDGTLFAAVVGNELQTTADGVNYTGTGLNAESIPYVTYQNGAFYFAATVGLQSSPDGAMWTQVTGQSNFDLFVTSGSVDFLHRHSVGEGHLIGANSANWQATPVHGKVILDDPGHILDQPVAMVRTENRLYSKVGFYEDGTWLLQPDDRPMNAPVAGHLDRHVTNRGFWGTGATSADQLCVTIGNLRKRAARWLETRSVLDLVADVNRACQ